MSRQWLPPLSGHGVVPELFRYTQPVRVAPVRGSRGDADSYHRRVLEEHWNAMSIDVPDSDRTVPQRLDGLPPLPANGTHSQLPRLLRDLIAASTYRQDLRGLAVDAGLAERTVRQLVTWSTGSATGEWQSYQRLLATLGVTPGDLAAARSLWATQHTAPDKAFTPAEATRDDEIEAADPAEFAELLASLRIRSGESVTKIAGRAGIPRSQAYAMVDKKRTTLPRRAEQVSAFVRACGLGVDQSELVLRLWVRLTETKSLGHPAIDDDTDGETDDSDEVIGAASAMLEEMRDAGQVRSRPCWAAVVLGIGAACVIAWLPPTVRVPAVIVPVAVFVACVLIAVAALPQFRMSLRRRRSNASDQ